MLDAADHVGGMTRRVEFDVDGRQLVTFGGASGFSGTRSWSSPINRRFLADIGVDIDTMPAKGDPAVAALGAATFLDRETFGEDRVVPGAGPVVAWPAEPVTLAHLAVPARLSYLATTSYRSFLRDDWRLGADADLFTRRTIGTFGSPAGCVAALDALRAGFPGFDAIDLGAADRSFAWMSEPLAKFPDGLATVAQRALQHLQRAGVRVQTGSTVTAMRTTAAGAEIDYRDGRGARRVRATHCVFAAWSRVLPQVMGELDAAQAAALRRVVKQPMCYVKAAIRSWRGFAELGLREFNAPGAFFYKVELDPVVTLDRAPGVTPDDPIVVQLVHRPVVDPDERDYRVEARLAQAAMLQTTPGQYRDAVHDVLGRMLHGTSFDADRDIAGIVVNRWPHTYSSGLNSLVDDEETARREMLLSRAPVGAVTIAGVDAHRFGWAQIAIDSAERAVNELPTGAPELGSF